MRILVVGSHHGVGAHVVKKAIAKGHEVQAFEGDVLDEATVASFVEGCDVVLSTLGPRDKSPVDLCSRGMRNIVQAMKAHGVRRLVQVTGAMIGHPHERLGWMYKFIAALVPEAALRNRRLQEEIVKTSGLDWTLVRPTRLTDEPGRGIFRDGEHEKIGALAHISREDVAEAMLRAAEDKTTIGRALSLQY